MVRRIPDADCQLVRLETAGRYRLSGAFNFGSAGRLLAAGEAAFGGESEVQVDLSGVTQADSAGLAVLLGWVEHARSRRQRLSFVGLPAQLQAIAALSGVGEMLDAARATA